FGRDVPERMPPRRDDDMSSVELRDAVRDSPERARSLLTVRAAISFARESDLPCLRSLSLMCSYCRASFVPFLTPRGGIRPPRELCLCRRFPAGRHAKRVSTGVRTGIA